MASASSHDHASTSTALYSTASLRTALNHLHSALQILGPEAADALTALQLVPHVVDLESDPVTFLRREKFNAVAAAKRLATYWRLRKEIFGVDRAFRPLTLTGDGALDEDDIAAFRKGYYCLLPDHAKSGRSVVWYDRTGFCSLSPSVRRRLCFYVWNLASENELSAQDGVIGLCGVNNLIFDETSRANAYLVLNAFPIVMSSIHIFCLPETGFSFNMVAIFASLLVNVIGKAAFQLTSVHPNLRDEDRKSEILKLGFRLKDIPVRMGGSLEDLEDWICERQQLDEERYEIKPSAQIQDTTSTIIGPREPTGYSGGASSFLEQLTLQLLHDHTFGQAQGTTSLPPPTASFLQHQQIPSISWPNLNLEVEQQIKTAPPVNFTHKDSGEDPPEEPLRTPLTGHAAPPKNTPIIEEDGYTRLDLDWGDLPEETESSVAFYQKAVQEHLDTIAGEEKSAYVEALERVPVLVETETDVMRFVRRCDYNTSEAAQRLVQYWKLRKELFAERAFLPMTQTGNGALSQSDVVMLSSGALAILPSDAKGRSVLISDRSRELDSITESIESKLRTWFYLLSVVSEKESNQKDGYVLLPVVVTPRVSGFDGSFLKRALEIMHVVPAKTKALHALSWRPKSVKRTLVDEIESTVTTLFGGRYGKRFLLHSARSTEEIFAELEKFGLSRDGLPLVAGGCWKYEEFTKWQRKRIRHEQSAIRAQGRKNHASTSEKSAAANDKLAKPTGTDFKERKRMLNIIHSRQKRERRRAEMEKLQEECNILREKNAVARGDNARLEALLRDATQKALAIEQQQLNRSTMAGVQNVFDVTKRVSVTPGLLEFGGVLPPDSQLHAWRHPSSSFSAQVSDQELVQKLLLADQLNQEQVLRRDILSNSHASHSLKRKNPGFIEPNSMTLNPSGSLSLSLLPQQAIRGANQCPTYQPCPPSSLPTAAALLADDSDSNRLNADLHQQRKQSKDDFSQRSDH